jgi:hypothetical protein
MIHKSKLKPKTHKHLLEILGPVAWIAFIVSIFLGRLENPDLDFISGFLMGFAMVGNLIYIFATSHKLCRQNRK